MNRIFARRLFFGLLATLTLASCAPKQASAPAPEYVNHTVQYQGETLGLIASWYTGASSNWPAVAEANPGLRVDAIRIGDSVKIPKGLVRRSEPLPAELLAKGGPSEVPQELAAESIVPESKEQITADGEIVVGEGVTLKPVEKSPNNDLYMAVMVGDPAGVTKAIQAGADPNYVDNGRAILLWAAQNGNPEVVQALIDNKAELNTFDGVGHTALMRAADMNQVGVLEVLIKAGADLNLKSSRDGKTALSIAAYSGYLESARALLKGGADANIADADGNAPILMAAQGGYSEIINELAAAKADLNVSNIIYTPLSYAVEQGNKDLVETLLKAGASPDAKTQNGRVPLIIALDSPEIFELLLKYKANPNVTNSYGETALMVAIQNDSTQRIEQLLKAGADVNAKDGNGGTALTFANNMYKTEIAELLKRNGASE